MLEINELTELVVIKGKYFNRLITNEGRTEIIHFNSDNEKKCKTSIEWCKELENVGVKNALLGYEVCEACKVRGIPLKNQIRANCKIELSISKGKVTVSDVVILHTYDSENSKDNRTLAKLTCLALALSDNVKELGREINNIESEEVKHMFELSNSQEVKINLLADYDNKEENVYCILSVE